MIRAVLCGIVVGALAGVVGGGLVALGVWLVATVASLVGGWAGVLVAGVLIVAAFGGLVGFFMWLADI